MAALFNEPLPSTNEERKQLVLKHHIALWDVLQECEIKGADGQSIANIVVNPIEDLLKETKITKIYTTGKKATQLYQKHCLKRTGIEAIYLPSTSPANCRYYTLEDLIQEYRCLRDL